MGSKESNQTNKQIKQEHSIYIGFQEPIHEKLRYFSLIYAPMAIYNNGDHYNSLYEADQK